MRDAFAAAVQAAVDESILIGRPPVVLIQMLQQRHAVEVAKQLVVSDKIQRGLLKMREIERLDLSIESLMLQPQFAGLFSPQELDAARWHLEQA
jgi:hypothetical protein